MRAHIFLPRQMIIKYTLRTLKLLPLRFAFFSPSILLLSVLLALLCEPRSLSTIHRFAIVSQHLFRFLSPFLCTQHDAMRAASEWSGQLPRNRNVVACQCVCFRFLFKFICWINTSQRWARIPSSVHRNTRGTAQLFEQKSWRATKKRWRRKRKTSAKLKRKREGKYPPRKECAGIHSLACEIFVDTFRWLGLGGARSKRGEGQEATERDCSHDDKD